MLFSFLVTVASLFFLVHLVSATATTSAVTVSVRDAFQIADPTELDPSI